MFVQADNGRFLQDPIIGGFSGRKRWVVKFNDTDGQQLIYYNGKKVSWTTARKVLEKAGIKVKPGPRDGAEGLEWTVNSMKPCTIFQIELSAPLPATPLSDPESAQHGGIDMEYGLVLESEPAPGDFEIISFRSKSERVSKSEKKRQAIQRGEE